jgi:uncharacterized coiled-coil DUF342 family protein
MISQESIAKVKSLFEDWMELLDNRQEINNQIKNVTEEAAVNADVKKTVIRKAFTYLKKKHDSGTDELDEIVKFALELEG